LGGQCAGYLQAFSCRRGWQGGVCAVPMCVGNTALATWAAMKSIRNLILQQLQKELHLKVFSTFAAFLLEE
jgi:hypothetical protein